MSDFYEEDEDPTKILLAYARGEKFTTTAPGSKGHNYCVEIDRHCDGCTCEKPDRLATEEIVRALTQSLARDEKKHDAA